MERRSLGEKVRKQDAGIFSSVLVNALCLQNCVCFPGSLTMFCKRRKLR